MKWISFVILAIILAVPRMAVSEEDLTAEVLREYEELKALEAEAERLRQLKRYRSNEVKQLRQQLARTGDPIDGHELLEQVLLERTRGMASNPALVCEFRIWMHEIGVVDMVQRVSCNGAVIGVIYGAIGEHHNRLSKYKYQAFSHPREESYKVTIGNNKTSISRTYTTRDQ